MYIYIYVYIYIYMYKYVMILYKHDVSEYISQLTPEIRIHLVPGAVRDAQSLQDARQGWPFQAMDDGRFGNQEWWVLLGKRMVFHGISWRFLI